MDEFEKWLRTVCLRKPPHQAYDLAKCAWQEAMAAEREACATMVDHILREGGGTYGDDIRKRPNVKLSGSPDSSASPVQTPC